MATDESTKATKLESEADEAEETKEEDNTKDIEELLQWFVENPKLPKEIEIVLLKRFLKCMDGNMDDAKKLIELNYSMRNKYPHMFIDRDPHDDLIKISQTAGDICALPGLTPEGNKVLFFRIANPDPKLINSLQECKLYYMLSDSRFVMSDDEKNPDEHILAEGDVQIIDMKGYSMAHALRASIMIMRVHTKYMQEAYPIRLRSMHFINSPSFMDRIMSFVRPFLKDEIYNMMHIHHDMESLYEHVPRDMLPDEYGGTAGDFKELKDRWTQKMYDKQDYLMDPNYWKVEPVKSGRRFWW